MHVKQNRMNTGVPKGGGGRTRGLCPPVDQQVKTGRVFLKPLHKTYPTSTLYTVTRNVQKCNFYTHIFKNLSPFRSWKILATPLRIKVE